MKFSKEEIGFILYNNRSVNGVVKNFLPENIDYGKLIKIEEMFEWCKNLFSEYEKMVEVDISMINIDENDVEITPQNINNLSELITSKIGIFNKDEEDFLINRGISLDLSKKWMMFGLSSITNYDDLLILGATVHPILRKVLQDGLEGGGICVPFFKNNKLENCSIRKIKDIGKLKYTLAIPDIPVWGIEDIEGEEVWITEGLFDMISLRENGIKSCSPSSAVWSGIQLYKLLEKSPQKINIFVDNDMVGLKNGAILKKFFSINKISSITYHSKTCKDASEHFFEKNLLFNDIEEIHISSDMIKSNSDNSFNFLKHLQRRKF